MQEFLSLDLVYVLLPRHHRFLEVIYVTSFPGQKISRSPRPSDCIVSSPILGERDLVSAHAINLSLHTGLFAQKGENYLNAMLLHLRECIPYGVFSQGGE